MPSLETFSSNDLDDLDAEMEHHLGQVGLSSTLFEHLAETITPTSETGPTGEVKDSPVGKHVNIDYEDWEQ